MVDLKSLLSKPMDDVKPPVPLPAGTYHGVVKGQSFGESRQKKTPFVRYEFTLHSAGDDVDASQLEGVDLSTKSPRFDFYLTDNSDFRLKDFLTSVGVKTEGRSLGECIAEAVGCEVVLTIIQRYDEKDTSKVYTDVTDVKGTA